MAVSIDDIEGAFVRISPHIRRTPVVVSADLDRKAGARLYLKAESMQVTGSFKIRGATNSILQLSDEQLRLGVVTHSSGNHGAALAHAAKAHGAEATIIMPSNAPKCKIAAARGAGGDVVLCEATIEARTAAAQKHMEEHPRCTLIPPYNHPHIISGQGTVALELLQQVSNAEVLQLGTPTSHEVADDGTPDSTLGTGAEEPESDELLLDAVVVPVSGGGLISGIATAIKTRLPQCKVIAAEPRGKNDMADAAACMDAGELVHLPAPPDTIADGLRAQLGDVTWPIIKAAVDAVVTVSDAEIVAAMRALFEDTKLLVEPSGAAALAAALGPGLRRAAPGCRRVAVVLSGGNVDLDSVDFWEGWAARAAAG